MIPEGAFNCRPASRQSPKIWLQKVPGQDLAQNSRFPMIPEGGFNCRPKGPRMAEICVRKIALQDNDVSLLIFILELKIKWRASSQVLAQKGRFPRTPEEEFNSRPRGRQMPEICYQKAPGQD